jgi:osmotically-inducible protein OsmY
MQARTAKKLSHLLILGVAAVGLAPAAPPALCAQRATAGAVQQSNQTSDLDITRNIRRALIKDKSLSIEAHNVTIVTKDGRVTLKGRVKSDAEKQTVESAAASVAGPDNVVNQLTE